MSIFNSIFGGYPWCDENDPYLAAIFSDRSCFVLFVSFVVECLDIQPRRARRYSPPKIRDNRQNSLVPAAPPSTAARCPILRHIGIRTGLGSFFGNAFAERGRFASWYAFQREALERGGEGMAEIRDDQFFFVIIQKASNPCASADLYDSGSKGQKLNN